MNSKKNHHYLSITSILILLLHGSITIIAQSATQPKSIWTTKVDANECNILKISSDGGIVVVGSKGSGDSYSVLKYNRQGEFEWSNPLDSNSSLYATSITEVKGEGFSISGFIGAGNVRPTPFTYGYAAVINYLGVVSWKRTLRDDTKDFFMGLFDNPYIRTKDSGYALLYNNAIQPASKENGYELTFHYYNKNGDINNVILDTIKDCEEIRVHSFQQTADGGYFGYYYPTSENRPREYYVIKLDKNGAVQWKKTWQENVYTLRGGTALELSDGSFVVANNTIGPTGNAQLRKFSASGELMYHKEIIAKQLTKINAIAETKGNELVLAGCTLDFDGVDNKWPTERQDNYLGHVNSNGEIIERSVWGVENKFDILSQVAVTEDGNYIIGGIGGETGTAFISKITPNVSSVFEVTSEANVFNLRVIEEGTKQSAAYTIPNNANVTVSIYNLEGKEVHPLLQNTYQQAGTYNIPLTTSQLVTGQYFLRFTDGKTSVTKPLVIVR